MHETVSFSFAVIFLFSLNRNFVRWNDEKPRKSETLDCFSRSNCTENFTNVPMQIGWLNFDDFGRNVFTFCFCFVFSTLELCSLILIMNLFTVRCCLSCGFFFFFCFLWLLLKLVKINCTQNYLHGNYLLRWILLIEKLFFIIQFKDWEKRDKNKSKELTKDYTVVLNFVCVIFCFIQRKRNFCSGFYFCLPKGNLVEMLFSCFCKVYESS